MPLVHRHSILNSGLVTINPDLDLKSLQRQPLLSKAELPDIVTNQATESLYTLNTGCALVVNLNAPLKLALLLFKPPTLGINGLLLYSQGIIIKLTEGIEPYKTSFTILQALNALVKWLQAFFENLIELPPI